MTTLNDGPTSVARTTRESTTTMRAPAYTGDDIDVVNRYSSVNTPTDRIRWGPILAGLVTTVATIVILTVLGLALGASVFEPTSEGQDVGIFAAIYAGASALIAFFLGGWVAGRTAAVRRDDNGLLNGFMVGAAAIALILWLTATGLGNILGGIGNNVGDIINIGTEQVQSGQVDPNQVQGQAQNTVDRAQQAAVNSYDEARDSAWGTLAGLGLALGAAALGGLLGHKTKESQEHDGDVRVSG